MKLAIFDFDGTLFLQDTLPFLLKQWGKLNYSKAKLIRVLISISWLFVGYKLRIRRGGRERAALEAMQKVTRIFAGMEKAEVEEFFRRCLVEVKTELNTEVVQEVKRTKALGCRVVLLSGCYEYLLELIGGYLEIDTIIGTKMHYKDGKADTGHPLEVTYGSQKTVKLHEYFEGEKVDWKESFAYADSLSDLPVLEIVGNPVVVNPDSRLEEIAKKAGWRLIDTGKRAAKL